MGRSSCHREASPRRPVFTLHAGLDLSRRRVDVCLRFVHDRFEPATVPAPSPEGASECAVVPNRARHFRRSEPVPICQHDQAPERVRIASGDGSSVGRGGQPMLQRPVARNVVRSRPPVALRPKPERCPWARSNRREQSPLAPFVLMASSHPYGDGMQGRRVISSLAVEERWSRSSVGSTMALPCPVS